MSRLRRIENWPELARVARYQVKSLAEICDASPRQLQRFLLEATGLRAHDWMNRLRQTEALVLLRKLGSVKATALQLRYKQPSHFSVQFRNFFGISPSQFLSGKNVAFSNAMSDFHIPLDFSREIPRGEIGDYGKASAEHEPLTLKEPQPKRRQ